MKVEDLVTKLQATKGDPEPILRRLMERLEGMLNDTVHVKEIAKALGVSWEKDLSSPDSSPLLAWARLVRELHERGRIGELVPIVVPLLPERQAYTAHEFFGVDTEIASETTGNNRKALEAARARKAEMIGWNAVHSKGPLHVTPDPIRVLGSSNSKPRRGKRRAA